MEHSMSEVKLDGTDDGAVVLGAVQRQRAAPAAPMEDCVVRVDPRLVSLTAPDSLEAEQYLGLRYIVEQMRKPGGGVIVGICSPTPGDGKSVTAINLVGALARDPKARVLLVEVDLRRSSVTSGEHLTLRYRDHRGLADAVRDTGLPLEKVIQPVPTFNFAVLPAGACPAAPYELLRSPRLGELLAQARQRYDYVILDAPPVVPVPDCRLISKWVDGFFMVVAADRTPRAALAEALNLLSPESVLGLVFNRYDRSLARQYGYRSYGYTPATNRKRRSWWTSLLRK
ncbi:MAG: tyrosine-protein kinase family protein [Sulfurifustis sp.]